MDERIKKMADILVNYSIEAKKGDRVQIVTEYDAKELALECYRICVKNGAFPSIDVSLPGAGYIYYKYATDAQLKRFPKVAWYEVQNTDCVLYIGAEYNTKELTSIDPKKISLRRKITHKIQEWRVNKTRWCIFEYPTNALAQDAEMSLEEFEDFDYGACIVDWKEESKKQDKLKAVVDKGSKVRIIGKNTDLTFSIKGRQGIKCDGKRNMPDGEVFCAPVDDSAEGYIEYSFPVIYGGKEVSGVRLKFHKGKVVEAHADKNEDYLIKMIDTDKGSRYLGEFGIGVNYNIKKFIKQILFDEKIGGTIHLALGSAYKEGGGKNVSAIHWDMIKDLRDGGELYIDGKLIQKNGKFLI